MTNLQSLRDLVNRQAEDEGLWFAAKTAPEAYLQQALRKLHAAIEAQPDEPDWTDAAGKRHRYKCGLNPDPAAVKHMVAHCTCPPGYGVAVEPTGNPTVDEANFQLRRLNKMVEKLGEPQTPRANERANELTEQVAADPKLPFITPDEVRGEALQPMPFTLEPSADFRALLAEAYEAGDDNVFGTDLAERISNALNRSVTTEQK